MAMQEEFQQKMVFYQLLQKQLEQLQAQAVFLQQQAAELDATMGAIGDMQKPGAEKAVIMPLGSGCYAEGRMEDRERVLVSIGAGIVLRKSAQEAGEFLNGRKADIDQMKQDLQNSMQAVAGKMSELLPELQKMAAEMQGKK